MKTYRMILIDPDERTVLHVESSGTLEHVQQLVQTDFVEPLGINGDDVMLFAEEPKQGVQPFKIGEYVIRGRAVVVGRGDVEFSTPKVSIDTLRPLVAFQPK